MLSKPTRRIWIEEREKELRKLEEWQSTHGMSIETELENVLMENANCEEEIWFIEKLENKPGSRLINISGMKDLLAEMKAEIKKQKEPLEKRRRDLETKLAKRKLLKVYVELAKNKYQ